MRQGPSLGYGGAQVRLAPRSLGLGYGAGTFIIRTLL